MCGWRTHLRYLYSQGSVCNSSIFSSISAFNLFIVAEVLQYLQLALAQPTFKVLHTPDPAKWKWPPCYFLPVTGFSLSVELMTTIDETLTRCHHFPLSCAPQSRAPPRELVSAPHALLSFPRVLCLQPDTCIEDFSICLHGYVQLLAAKSSAPSL